MSNVMRELSVKLAVATMAPTEFIIDVAGNYFKISTGESWATLKDLLNGGIFAHETLNGMNPVDQNGKRIICLTSRRPAEVWQDGRSLCLHAGGIINSKKLDEIYNNNLCKNETDAILSVIGKWPVWNQVIQARKEEWKFRNIDLTQFLGEGELEKLKGQYKNSLTLRGQREAQFVSEIEDVLGPEVAGKFLQRFNLAVLKAA